MKTKKNTRTKTAKCKQIYDCVHNQSYFLTSAASEMREAPNTVADEKTDVITKTTNGTADIPSKDQSGPDKKVGQCHVWMTPK